MTTTTTHQQLDARDMGVFDAVGYMAKNIVHKAIRLTDTTDRLFDTSDRILDGVDHCVNTAVLSGKTMESDATTDNIIAESRNEVRQSEVALEVAKNKAAIANNLELLAQFEAELASKAA